MGTLYEITGNLLELQNMLEAGEYSEEELADTMEAVQGELEEKAQDYGFVIRNLEASSDAIQKEIDRLSAKQTACKNGVKRMKEALKAAMIASGNRKVKTDLFLFTVRKNGGKQPMKIDEQDIGNFPEQFIVIRKDIDKEAIRKALEAGDPDVEGKAHFEERGVSLVIKCRLNLEIFWLMKWRFGQNVYQSIPSCCCCIRTPE